MPAKDKIHDALIEALQKDGWTITADPYFIKVGRKKDMLTWQPISSLQPLSRMKK